MTPPFATSTDIDGLRIASAGRTPHHGYCSC